jgi:hypothetical protein
MDKDRQTIDLHIVVDEDDAFRILGGYSSGEVAISKAQEWVDARAIKDLENTGTISGYRVRVYGVPLDKDCFSYNADDDYHRHGRVSPCVGSCIVSTDWTVNAWKAHLAKPNLDREVVRNIYSIIETIKSIHKETYPSKWSSILKAQVIKFKIQDQLMGIGVSFDKISSIQDFPLDLLSKLHNLKDLLDKTCEQDEIAIQWLINLEQVNNELDKWFDADANPPMPHRSSI